MIQDIDPLKLNNSFSNKYPSEDSYAICIDENRVLCVSVGEASMFDFPHWRELCDSLNAVYLFSIGRDQFFMPLEYEYKHDRFKWFSLRELREKQYLPKWKLFAAFTGYHLCNWYRTNRYCGVGGHRTFTDSNERALLCPECGNRIYPRINPAVIIGVINGEKLLLTKYKTGYAHNALVAGFTEIGETLEETVSREVMEEVGLHVKNIRYYKSQPWGIACDVLMGFYCEVDGSDEIKRDDQELKYAAWVDRLNIELQPTDDSLTNEMMKAFKYNKVQTWERKDC